MLYVLKKVKNKNNFVFVVIECKKGRIKFEIIKK